MGSTIYILQLVEKVTADDVSVQIKLLRFLAFQLPFLRCNDATVSSVLTRVSALVSITSGFSSRMMDSFSGVLRR